MKNVFLGNFSKSQMVIKVHGPNSDEVAKHLLQEYELFQKNNRVIKPHAILSWLEKTNSWLFHYNRSGIDPIYCSLAIHWQEPDGISMLLGDEFYFVSFDMEKIFFSGNKFFFHQDDSFLTTKKIMIPEVLLGAYAELPIFHIDKIPLQISSLIFPAEVQASAIKKIVEENSFDKTSILEALTQLQIPYWRVI